MLETMSERQRAQSDRIIVVGAGVVGAAVAHHLSRAGHDVVVLDRGTAGQGVTAASFAWVGVAKSSAAVHADPRRRRAMAEFDRVLTEVGEPIGLRRFGALTWEDTEALTCTFVSEHQAAGHRMELLTGREAMWREPTLRTAPDAVAYAPDDLGVDPVAYTRALLNSARAHGAELQTNTSVSRLLVDDGRVRGVLTDRGELTAKRVVLAAGTASVGLAAPVGIDLDVRESPCCLLRFSTTRPLVRGILSTPDLEVRQLNDTTLLAAEDVPDGFTGDPRELAGPTLEALRRTFSDVGGTQLVQAVIADRPMPAEGRPLVGEVSRLPGLHLAIAHPGVILSAEIGRQVAADLASI